MFHFCFEKIELQVKEKKTHIRTPKPPFIDFSPFKSSTVRMLIMCSSIASLGAYAPIFFMSLHGFQEGFDVQDLVLLQTFLGLSIAFGNVASGSTINKIFSISYRRFNISRQYVCQVCFCLFRCVPFVYNFSSFQLVVLLPFFSMRN